jgi:hypothetical protein
MTAEMAGWQIATAALFVGGEITLAMRWWGEHIHAEMVTNVRNLKKLRSPRPRGSGDAGGSDIPQSLRLHGGPVSPPAPPDTASSRVAVSGGLNPAGVGGDSRAPVVPALAGPNRGKP